MNPLAVAFGLGLVAVGVFVMLGLPGLLILAGIMLLLLAVDP